MAKVALITETINPAVQSLATALTHQRQDVVIITTRGQSEKAPTGISTLAPFKKWSAFETIRALPSLISQNFDVWHFIYSQPDQHPLTAQWLMASVARTLPNKVVAASFATPENIRTWDWKFLSILDLALFSSRSFLMRAKRQQALSAHTIAEVLPPLDIMSNVPDSRVRDEIPRLLKGLRPFLLLPDLHDGPEWINHSPVDFVVLKAPPKKGSSHQHVFYTGDLLPSERDLLIEKSKAVCLLYGDYSVLELQQYHQWSERAQKPMLVQEHQTQAWPGLCWHEKSGWVLPDRGEHLRDLLIQNPSLHLPNGFQNFSQRELVDSTLNELIRLYQRSFRIRWT